MKKIVFSKQADHDIDLAPFWLHWYKNIFKADRIIVTPLKLPTSSIKKIVEYYSDKDVNISPIEMEYWDDNRIWTIQRDMVRDIVGLKQDYIYISADTDQFFQPIDPLYIDDSLIVFERINILAEDTPGVENIDHVSLKELLGDERSVITPEKDFVAGFVGTLEHSDIFTTGHYTGPIENISKQNVNLKEFHIRLRGAEQFINKIESLNFQDLSGNPAWHFKRWVRILKNEGKEGLLAEYKAMMNTKHSLKDKNINKFRELTKEGPSPSPINWETVNNTLKEGEMLFSENRHTEAKSRFIELLKMIPEHCYALNNLGVIETSAGKMESAIGYFQKSIDVNPFCVDTLSNLGHILSMASQNKEAIEYFSRAIQIKGNEASLWNRLGECFLNINDIEKAQTALRKSTLVDGKPENLREIEIILDRNKDGTLRLQEENTRLKILTPKLGMQEKQLTADEWHGRIIGNVKPEQIASNIRREKVSVWIHALIENSKPGDRILEVGSGTGELSAYLAYKGREVVLLDYSKESLEYSEQVFSELNLSGDFILADVTRSLPFCDGCFDMAWSSGLLEHFNDNEIAHILKESARISKIKVLSLVPNANSLPYRLGKWHQEQSGQWQWGYEDAKFTMADFFREAGLVKIKEFSVAPMQSIQFLKGPEMQHVAKTFHVFFEGISLDDLKRLNQGYLLATVGFMP